MIIHASRCTKIGSKRVSKIGKRSRTCDLRGEPNVVGRPDMFGPFMDVLGAFEEKSSPHTNEIFFIDL